MEVIKHTPAQVEEAKKVLLAAQASAKSALTPETEPAKTIAYSVFYRAGNNVAESIIVADAFYVVNNKDQVPTHVIFFVRMPNDIQRTVAMFNFDEFVFAREGK